MQRLAAGQDGCAFPAPNLHVAFDAGELLLGDLWAHLRGQLRGIADCQRAGFFSEPIQELVLDPVGQEKP